MRHWLAIAVVFAGLASAGPAFAAERPRTPTAEESALRKQLVDMTLDVERLHAEIRELRGQLEVQTHELNSLKTRHRDALSDTDKRLRELERRSAPAAGGETSPTASAPASAPAPSAPAGAGEQQEYDAAFNLLKQGYYERSAKAFRDFIARHPSSELAGNAQYWIGEALYVVRNFKQALEEFNKVVEKYPSSAKAGDALLKIGYVQYELGNVDKAREALQRVVSNYPNTTVARSAERRLSEIAAATRPKTPETKGGVKR